MKSVLFLSFSGYSEHNGISKKKLAQIKGLEECGCDVTNCYYMVDLGTGHRLWMADGSIVIDLGTGIGAKIRKRIDYNPILTYIKQERISFVYMRSEHNASPFLISFVRRLRNSGVKIVMEIPTYPYDQEYDTFKGKSLLFVDKIFRKSLAKQLNAIVTFSNEPIIFGQRTIRISNGIDFDSIRLKQNGNGKSNEIHLIAVAEIHYWHGWDRIVSGLADYYKSDRHYAGEVYLHIVGEFSGERERNEIMPLIVENQLNNCVTLHGKLFGKELDEIFDRADVGIGSLARHRSNITHIKTLKNREYAARGIPFIYSEIDDDFEEMPYIMKVPADESPVDIHQIINFYNRITMNTEQIRNSVRHLSWKNQMKKVLDSIDIAVYENKNSLR
ncbi:MAG: glycosyltransferase family 1 protein [Porphyromonadaceae bacterium]|nr:glycosyltransferase family 1 protein [Porphyromonadaceae bacterium]